MPWSRDTAWRQGSALLPESFELFASHGGDFNLAIAITHDCDIANDNVEAEPVVEFVLGRTVEEADGNKLYAKNPRLLNLVAEFQGAPTTIELCAAQKIMINKEDLSSHSPDGRFLLDQRSLLILRDWLSARYRRQAFPDSFNGRLSPISRILELHGKKNAHGVLGLISDN